MAGELPFHDGQTVKVDVLLQVEGTQSLVRVGVFSMQTLASLTPEEAERVEPGLMQPGHDGALAVSGSQLVLGLRAIADAIEGGA